MPNKQRSSQKRSIGDILRARNAGSDRQKYLLSQDGKCYSNYANIPRQISSGNRLYDTVQTCVVNAWATTSTTLYTYVSQQFTFGDIDQSAQLAAVFDQYRITSVECYVHEAAANQNLANDGELTTVVDFDDAATPTGLILLDYDNAVTTSSASAHYRHFCPHAALAAYTGSFTGFSNVAAPWIDAASTNVVHYGLKAMISPSTTSKVITLTYRLHVQLRSVR